MMEVKDVVSWTTMLDMYVEMREMGEARRVFHEMPERNAVTWSAMIARLSQSGDWEEAARLFEEMVRCGFKPNISCYSSVISALASLKALQGGRSIHGLVLKSGVDMNVFVGCSLIDLYYKCGSSDDGRLVFDALPHKNVVCWNSMVSGYSSNGMISVAVEVFNRIPQRNNVPWNSLIAGHLGVEDFDEAFEVFHVMILCGEQPSKSSFSSVLRACVSLASLERGKYAHAKALKLGFQFDIFIDTADMYAKSGEIWRIELILFMNQGVALSFE